MACLDFGVPFSNVATSSTAKSVAGIKTPANQAVRVTGFDIGFDGTNAASGPALVEVCQATFATNAPGTNSTSVTPVALDSGRPETIQSTAAKSWSAEPTVLTVQEAFFIPVYMGSGIIFYPLSKPLVCKGGGGMVIRITQQSGVTANASGTIKCEE